MKLKQMIIMKILIETKNLFDFSDYPLDSKFFNPVNKNVITKMKDEFQGKIISEIIGLKSKMFSLTGVVDEEITTANRVKKKVRQFVYALFIMKMIRHGMKRIQSKLHRIGTYDACKISLSCFDNKYIY